MFESLTDANKETSQALKHWCVYDTRLYTVGKVLTAVYHITRHITKQYSYVGLTEAAAKQGALDKTAQYTKTTKGWKFKPDDAEGPFVYQNLTKVVAEIVATHQQGSMWSVQINVNQTDEHWTHVLPASLESVFPAITEADYDE